MFPAALTTAVGLRDRLVPSPLPRQERKQFVLGSAPTAREGAELSNLFPESENFPCVHMNVLACH